MMSNDSLKRKILELAFSGKLLDTRSEWNIKNIDEVFITIPVKTYQINQTEIEPNGKYPVISQSKELIEGYSNEENKLLKLYDSYVVFGDHSKTVKYIDFPFVVGADGTKVFSSLENNVKYLYYHMLYNSFFIKSSGYTRNYKYLKEFKYYIPSKIEQDMIVGKIDELFELIEKKEKNDHEKDKLKEILKSKILGSAFCGTLVNNNETLKPVDNEEFKGEVLFEIPSNWKWCEYKSIGDSGIGLTYRPENVTNDGIIVLRSSNIQNGKLDLKDIVRVKCKVNDNIIVKENDILVCARNGSKRLVGKSCLLENMQEKMTYGAFMTIFRTPYFKYVYWFMQSRYYYNQLYENTNTMTINQVTQKKLNSLIIPLPPLEEQKRIVEKIESLFELIEQL